MLHLVQWSLLCFFFIWRQSNSMGWATELKSERMNTTHTELSKVSQCQSSVKQDSAAVKGLVFLEGPWPSQTPHYRDKYSVNAQISGSTDRLCELFLEGDEWERVWTKFAPSMMWSHDRCPGKLSQQEAAKLLKFSFRFRLFAHCRNSSELSNEEMITLDHRLCK